MAIDAQLPTLFVLVTVSLDQEDPSQATISKSSELSFLKAIRGLSLLSRAIEAYLPLSFESSSVRF